MSKILMCAAEGLPFIKSGGLADVIGSLPKALTALGHEVAIVLPLYKKIAKKHHHEFTFVCEYRVAIAYEDKIVRVFQQNIDGVMFYFIEHAGYFERDNLYGYADDGERFAYFQKAILELLNQIDYFPDVMHAHDWHTGMLPAMCKEVHGYDERYRKIKHLYTIHNLAYQGNFARDMLWSCLGLGEYTYENGSTRMYDGISFMKSGIVYADKVNTVSQTYAQEILTPTYGEHLEHVLQSRKQDLSGIVNGIDYDIWNTKSDEFLVENYNKVNVHKQKKVNKQALQEELGLVVDSDVLVVSMVTRLAWQKGIHLVLEKLDEILGLNVQVVILGSGEEQLHQKLRTYEERYPGKFSFYQGYNEELAHRIYAGSDLFVMPSLFEPCGISQLIAMRYGTLPLVRETGGLVDTVAPYNIETKAGRGFSFKYFTSYDFMEVFNIAYYTYYDRRKDWNKLIKNAMNYDVSWDKSAYDYDELYRSLI